MAELLATRNENNADFYTVGVILISISRDKSKQKYTHI